jgi:hypothetical protein
MRYARPLIAGAAALLAATLGATSVLAAAAWTIKPGGAVSASAPDASFKDTKTRSNQTCNSMTASPTLKSGGGVSGSGAGSIPTFTFNHCTGPLGHTSRITFSVTATDLPWHLNLASYGNGVVTGRISHMQIQLQGPSCSAVIAGTSATATDGHVRFSYSDVTGHLKTLTTGGNLHFYNVTGCAGLFINGDPMTMTANFAVSPKQAITSP